MFLPVGFGHCKVGNNNVSSRFRIFLFYPFDYLRNLFSKSRCARYPDPYHNIGVVGYKSNELSLQITVHDSGTVLE